MLISYVFPWDDDYYTTINLSFLKFPKANQKLLILGNEKDFKKELLSKIEREVIF
jgi:hypothetical protein